MNDNGIPIAETQRELTPMQRFVYAVAKDYHTDDVDVKPDPSIQQGHQATRGF